MSYAYPVIILLSGLILIFSLSRENKIFFLPGGYFLVLGAWWLADLLLPEADLFAGWLGVAFKVLTGAVLAVLVAVFVLEYRKRGRDAGDGGKDPEKKP